MKHSCLVYKQIVLAMPMRLADNAGVRHIPLIMLDEQGEPIPQPWPDTDEMALFRAGSSRPGMPAHPGLWIVDLANLPIDFTNEDLHPREWQETQLDTPCKCFDAETRTIALTPGHQKNARGRVILDTKDLTLSHVAFGGLAMYEEKQGKSAISALPRKGRHVLSYVPLALARRRNTNISLPPSLERPE